MKNRITVYNIKGGVGKTRIALNLALTLRWGIVTNDEYSVVEDVMPPERHIILPEAGDEDSPANNLDFPEHIPLIFDMGGKADWRAKEAMKQSSHVIVPIETDKGDLQKGLDFLQEILTINEKIVIAVNKTRPNQFQQVGRVLQHIYPELAVFEIKASTAMSRIVTEKRSIGEIMIANKLFRRHYEKIDRQFQAIIDHIQNT